MNKRIRLDELHQALRDLKQATEEHKCKITQKWKNLPALRDLNKTTKEEPKNPHTTLKNIGIVYAKRKKVIVRTIAETLQAARANRAYTAGIPIQELKTRLDTIF